jgi:hypothetical protein
MGLLFAPSCSDFMDYPPPTEISADALWQDGILAEALMYRIYFTFQDAGFTEETLASATDESMFIHGREFRQTMAGAVNDLQLGYIGKEQSGHQWAKLYLSIRTCNDFIANIDAATFDNRDKNQLKGEAYFLRAYFYHRLTRAFGGVPLILNVTTLQDDVESFQVPRSSYTECIDQVLSDLGQAETLLAGYNMDNTLKGRATAAAVKALRVRVLTDAASNLHDEPTATAHASIFASYANKELLFYNKGSRADRWNAAKNAAKDLMDNPLGHELPTFGGDGLSVEEKAQAYWSHFNQDSPDHIFSRYFIFTKGEAGTRFSLFNGPAGYHAWGGNVPTQDMVDSYSMADGSAFDWNNAEMKAAPYKNREPRFYASIFYDGAQWIQRPSDYAVSDPSGRIQTGYYQLNPGDAVAAYWPGMDTREGGGENWNATFTGYYVKKFVNPRDGVHANNINSVFPFIRLTEVYYDYIEACIELNELDEAKTYLNQIRKSVGMSDITSTSQAELRSIYQNERRKDFFYEEHRYWDMRRWLIAQGAPGLNSLKGVTVNAALKPGVTLGAGERYTHDETRWNYTYTVEELSVEPRNFPDKCYFMPIHRDEMNRNLTLIQNPGY